MGLLSYFIKKKGSVNNEMLITHISRAAIKSLQEDYELGDNNFVEIAYIRETRDKISSAFFYQIEPCLCYKRGQDFFGWIHVWDEYQGDTTGTGIWLYLVKTTQNASSYQTIFSCSFDENIIANASFDDKKISDHHNSVSHCLEAIKNYAVFNNYQTPPPYYLYASMVN